MTLKKLIAPSAGVILPGVANALTAKIAAAAGFETIYVTGAGVANTFLGMPDVGLLTLTELVQHVSAIRSAVDVPIIVDADTGFGNAVNTQRTVRELERAGAGAIQLEDQVFPKRCGHFEGTAVISKGEMVQKIRAAVDARKRDDFLVIGRTDARSVEGLTAALDRAAAYQEAGADILFVEAPASVEELRQIPRQVPGVHLCNMVFGGKTPLLPAASLAEMGFAGILYANAALQASLKAMTGTLEHLYKRGSIDGLEDLLASFQERQQALSLAEFIAANQRYDT